jgi:hypothetical protein
VSDVCCQVENSATGWLPVQRSLTDCVVPECDREASIKIRPWPTSVCPTVLSYINEEEILHKKFLIYNNP